MELKILGSSSAGNCYVFDNGVEALVLECGVRFAEVQRAVDFDLSRVVGCVVSHEHGDHAREVQKFVDARIPVYASAGTIRALSVKGNHRGHYPLSTVHCPLSKLSTVHCPLSKLLRPVRAREPFSLGGFKVLAFDVRHDAAQPFGFLLAHAEMGTTLFATDTYYLAYRFAGLNHILIECNYRLDILNRNVSNGSVPAAVRDRVLQSHMSYDTCLETLLANDLSAVNNIVLIHLSERNSDAAAFQQGIEEATGKKVHVALFNGQLTIDN